MEANDRGDVAFGNFTYHTAQSNMELLPNYYKWMYGCFDSYLRGRVIDLGCGAGIGIQFYLNHVDEVYAVDFNQHLLRRVKRAYLDSKVKTAFVDLNQSWSGLTRLAADVVVMMDVLEHFQDDAVIMRQVSQCVKPGGYVAVKVPAGAALYSEIDIASGHYRRYDSGDLERLVAPTGLVPISVRSVNPLGAIMYRLKKKKKTNFSKTFSKNQLKIINKLIPLLSVLDDMPMLQGLSWMAVFQKRR